MANNNVLLDKRHITLWMKPSIHQEYKFPEMNDLLPHKYDSPRKLFPPFIRV